MAIKWDLILNKEETLVDLIEFDCFVNILNMVGFKENFVWDCEIEEPRLEIIGIILSGTGYLWVLDFGVSRV